MRFLYSLLCLLLLTAVCAAPVRSQQPDLTPPGTQRRDENEADRRFRHDIEEKQKREQNQERQKKIKADTDRLLQLATELKQYVDKTNENTLSVEVVRKADEIEKLAHNVKEKMRDGM